MGIGERGTAILIEDDHDVSTVTVEADPVAAKRGSF